MSVEKSVDALEVVKNNIREYSVGIAQGRAYPSLKDGLKQSYRRAIYGMHLHNTHRTVKVAELAAFALPYHPHPTSIGPVIVSMGDGGNKLKLLETHGNFGNSARGVEASAERYIGGYLSDLAESLLCDSVEYCNMVKGEIEKDEPEALPALLPLCFINGMQGIPSGLPTLNIPTLNIEDMIDYYIDILQHKDLSYTPKKLPKPNFELDVLSTKSEWDSVLKTGKGTLKVAPIMSIDKNDVITITSMPSSKTVESVQKIVEKEFLLDKIDIRDESTESLCIVIEKVPRKQCDMREIYQRLYKKLSVSETFNISFFDDEKIYVPCSFDKAVKANISYLIETHKNRINCQIEGLKNKLVILEIVDKLRSTGNIKKIAELDRDGAISYLCTTYKISTEQAREVLSKPISYLTREHIEEMVGLRAEIEKLEADNSDIYSCLIKKYKEVKKLISKQVGNKFLPTNFVG